MFLAGVTVVALMVVGAPVVWGLRIRSWKAMSTGGKLLWLSGIFYIPGGLVWLLKWSPSQGPYGVGENYIFGSYLQAWEVSMGFAFLAFGLLFSSAVLLMEHHKTRWVWTSLLTAWLLVMFPHFLIGVTFALDDPSLASLGVARFAIPNTLLWMAMVILGFFKTYGEITHQQETCESRRKT